MSGEIKTNSHIKTTISSIGTFKHCQHTAVCVSSVKKRTQSEGCANVPCRAIWRSKHLIHETWYHRYYLKSYIDYPCHSTSALENGASSVTLLQNFLKSMPFSHCYSQKIGRKKKKGSPGALLLTFEHTLVFILSPRQLVIPRIPAFHDNLPVLL